MTVYILGAGGHAKVCKSAIVNFLNFEFLDKNDEVPESTINGDEKFVIGVGDLKTRRRLFDKYSLNRYFFSFAHPSAIVGIMGAGIFGYKGLQIMAGVIVQPDVTFDDNVLINTGAHIDHDCVIDSHCHIAPGAILCGGVKLGHSCFIGAGAIIVEGVELEPETFVPAGTLVVKQNDFRRPQRDVLYGGANKTGMEENFMSSGAASHKPSDSGSVVPEKSSSGFSGDPDS